MTKVCENCEFYDKQTSICHLNPPLAQMISAFEKDTSNSVYEIEEEADCISNDVKHKIKILQRPVLKTYLVYIQAHKDYWCSHWKEVK